MAWQRVVRRQAGVITTSQLRSAGISEVRTQGLIRAGSLRRVARGLYLAPSVPTTERTRLWLAHLATGGTISHGSAVFLWGMRKDAPAAVHVTVPPSRRVRSKRGVVMHRVELPPREVGIVEDLPVTSRAWSVMDYLAGQPPEAGAAFADRALQQRWLNPAQLAARLRDHPDRLGNPALRAVLRLSTDRAAAESERRLHLLLRRARLQGWVANHPVLVDGRVVAEVDVAFPDRRLAIEVDGWAWHSDAERFRADRRRQNLLVGLGWTVLRFTWDDLINRPEYVVATIRRQLDRAKRQRGAKP